MTIRMIFFVVSMLILIVGMSSANLLSNDEVQDLFKKYVKRKLSEDKTKTLNDVLETLRFPHYLSGDSLEQMSKPRLSLLCFGCRVIVHAFFEGVPIVPEKLLASAVLWLCTKMGFGTYNVCKGATDLYVPILTHIIKNNPEVKSQTLCGLVLQVAEDPDVCPYDDPRFEWHVDLPDSIVVQKRPISTNVHVPLKIALITDVHVDPLYKPKAVANCGEPACCRAGQTAGLRYTGIDESIYENSFIRQSGQLSLNSSVGAVIRKIRQAHISEPLKASPAGYWGDYGNCDTPLWSFDDLIDRIAEEHKSIDVVYYIGDTIDHHVWETTYKQANRMNSYVVNKIRRTFGDKVKLVPVIGNHESQPINQFAPASVKRNKLNTTWLYKSLFKKWKFYLNADARASFLKRGEYSMLVRPGLRAIALNSNVAYKYNWWQLYDPRDAKKHLDWLVDELHKAELAGEKVHILSHIPPGEADLTYTWTREYNRIVNRFASTIAAEFNGHTHTDEFRIFYNQAGKAVRVAWNAGGFTTYSNLNPNYKIVEFHPFTYEATNIQTYIYNLTQANLNPKRRPHWFRLYDFKTKFRLPDLSPASLDLLVNRMARNKQLLDMYSDYFYKMSDARPSCDTKCKLEELCRTVVTVLWDRQKCNDLKKAYYNYTVV